MKLMRCYYLLLAICLLISMGGCANRNARSSPPYAEAPQLYPATRYALSGKVAQHWVDRVPPSQSSGYWLFPSDFLKVAGLQILAGTTGYLYSVVVETPASLVVDTVLIPVDAKRVRDFNRRGDEFYEALFGDQWPIPPETLLSLYQPATGDKVIREWVARPETPHYRAKLVALAEAGIRLPDLARSPAMDEALATLLLEKAQLPGQVPRFVTHSLAANPTTPVSTLLTLAEIDEGPILSVHRQLAEDPRTTPEILVALVTSPEERGLKYSEPERTALLWRAARHPAHTPESLQIYAEAQDGYLGFIVARHPNATAAVLETVLERAIESRSTSAAEPIASHPQTTADLLYRLTHEMIGTMIKNESESIYTDELAHLSRILDQISRHPSAGPQVREAVLSLTTSLLNLVDPGNERLRGQIEEIRFRIRELQ